MPYGPQAPPVDMARLFGQVPPLFVESTTPGFGVGVVVVVVVVDGSDGDLALPHAIASPGEPFDEQTRTVSSVPQLFVSGVHESSTHSPLSVSQN